MTVGSEIARYREIIVRYLWLIILMVAIAGAVALVLSRKATPTFASTTTVRLASVPGGMLELDFNAQSTRLSNTAAKLVETAKFHDQVTALLKSQSHSDFSLKAEVIPDTELIEITAQSTVPTVARDAADGAAKALVDNSLEIYGGGNDAVSHAELEKQLQAAHSALDAAVEAAVAAQSGVDPSTSKAAVLKENADASRNAYQTILQRYQDITMRDQVLATAISIVDPAYLPDSPSSPKTGLNVVLAASGGLILGALLAFLREYFNTTVQGREDITSLTDAPIIGSIPQSARRLNVLKSKRVTKNDLRFAAAIYDRLGAPLLAFPPIGLPATIVITSPEPGTGKSTIISYLGAELAQAGFRVVLVDGDFRHQTLSRQFNSLNSMGLSDILTRNELTASAVLQNTPFSRLKLLPTGTGSGINAGLLTPSRLAPLISRLRSTCDYILIDSPSLLLVGDSTVLAKQADVVLLVVSQRHTQKSQLDLSITHLAEAGISNVAVVLNRVPRRRSDTYYEV